MRVNGRDARRYYIFKHKAQKSIVPDMAIEEDLARIHAGYSRSDYQQLPGASWWIDEDSPIQDSKARVVAAYRAFQLLEAIRQDVSMPEVQRGSSRSRR